MARRRTTRRSTPRVPQERASSTARAVPPLDASIVPRFLVGTVNGAETLAVGVLQLARSIMLTVVSGAMDLGTQAVSATAGVARGGVGAASRLVGELGGVAQRTVEATVASAQSVSAELSDALRAPRSRPGTTGPDRARAAERNANGASAPRRASTTRRRRAARRAEATVRSAA